MRTLGTRRAVLVAGVATVTAAALVACSAGQVAETALKNSSVQGVNAQNADGSVLIRGLAVTYKDPAGYPAGGAAPLEVNLYNGTKQSITVLVSSQPPAEAAEGQNVVAARSVVLLGNEPTTPSTAIPDPAGSRPAATPDTQNSDNITQPSSSAGAPSAQPSGSAPAAASGRPARIEIGPLGSAIFRPGDATTLQATDLTGALIPGGALNLVFEFSNGVEPLVVRAPVTVPASPASRAPGLEAENHEPE
jgi:hypothetical protein